MRPQYNRPKVVGGGGLGGGAFPQRGAPMKAPPTLYNNEAFRDNLKRLHSQFSFDKPEDLLQKQRQEDQDNMLKQMANKRQRLASMMNDSAEQQRDPIENLISRILYAEGDLDLNS